MMKVDQIIQVGKLIKKEISYTRALECYLFAQASEKGNL